MKKHGPIIPKDYSELQRQYGTYIQKLLNRYNKVERNFEDLHSYIWVKILEAQLLERFNSHIRQQIPKVVSGLEATDVLGISWKQWIQAGEEFHLGGKEELEMPTPINAAIFQESPGWQHRDALYALSDVLALTIERDIDGVWRLPFDPIGQEVRDGEVIGASRPEGFLKIPEVRVTSAQFKGYLTRSVLNHYANFCRTLNRRHKERPSIVRPGEEDAPSWEATLEDTGSASQEQQTLLAEAHDLIDHHLDGTPEGAELQRVIFSKLENGASLLQAMRDTNVNPRVRKILLRALTR